MRTATPKSVNQPITSHLLNIHTSLNKIKRRVSPRTDSIVECIATNSKGDRHVGYAPALSANYFEFSFITRFRLQPLMGTLTTSLLDSVSAGEYVQSSKSSRRPHRTLFDKFGFGIINLPL